MKLQGVNVCVSVWNAVASVPWPSILCIIEDYRLHTWSPRPEPLLWPCFHKAAPMLSA